MSNRDASGVSEVRGARGMLALTAATLVLATSQLSMCEERLLIDSAPAMAEGVGIYTVVWERSRGKGGSLEVQQFERSSLKPMGKPKTVLRRDDLMPGSVDLVAIKGNPERYLALSRVEEPHSTSATTSLLTVPLDEHGRLAGEETSFWMADSACPGAADTGEYVMLAFTRLARSHHYPHDDLGVLILDRDGGFRTWWEVAYDPLACSSVVRNGEIVIAWTSPLADRSGYKLRVAFEDPRPGGRHKRVVVPVGKVGAMHAHLVSMGNDWAILYEDAAEHLHIAVINSEGELLRVIDLPDEVDHDSADLGINERGLFLSWNDGKHVRFGDVDGRSRVMARAAGEDASATRAWGDGRRCLAVWTMDQKRAQMVESERCP
jgi:hypothetical protein